MNELKVCMLIDVWEPVYGGGIAHVKELSSRLAANHGCVVDIYTRKLKDPEGRVFDRGESSPDGRINVHRNGLATGYASPLGRLVYTLVTPLRLKRKYDMIHAHAYYGAYPGKLIKLLTKKPLIYTVHGIALKARGEMDRGLLSRIKSFMEDATLFRMRYDCQISVDSSIREYPNVNDRIEVIPNGVDVKRFDAVPENRPGGDAFRILYVGRLHPQKGVKYLIEAARDVIAARPQTEFVIVGSGQLEEELKRSVNDAGLGDHFIFRGELSSDAVVAEYKSADLFVLPSIYEGQPLTLLEAWAAKLPVVATDVGGNRDFIINGVNGHIVRPGDAAALSEAINRCVADGNLREMGLNGYEMVKEKYTWDIVAERTYNIYRELASQKEGKS